MSVQTGNVNQPYRFRYEMCQICSVNRILVSVRNTQSNGDLLICDKCKKTDVSPALRINDETYSNLATSNNLNLATSNNSNLATSNKPNLATTNNSNLATLNNSNLATLNNFESKKIMGVGNDDICVTILTSSSEFSANNETSQSFKCLNEDLQSTASEVHDIYVLQNTSSDPVVTDSSLRTNNAHERCASESDKEFVASSIGSCPVSGGMEPMYVCDRNHLDEELKISTEILEIGASQTVQQLRTCSISDSFIGESDSSGDNYVKTVEEDVSSNANATFQIDELKIDSKEWLDVSTDINIALSQHGDLLNNVNDDDDIVNACVKVEIEPSQVPPTLNCSVTNVVGHSSSDISVIDDEYTSRSRYVDVMDLSKAVLNTLNYPNRVELPELHDLLKDIVLDLILCRIDDSYTSKKPCCHQCRVCPKIFLHTAGLARHERTHTDLLSYAGRLRDRQRVVITESCWDGEGSDWEGDNLTCTHCDKMFDKPSVLARHVKQVHDRARQYKSTTHLNVPETSRGSEQSCWDGEGSDCEGDSLTCTHCDKTFGKPSGLTRHIKQVHGRARQYKSTTHLNVPETRRASEHLMDAQQGYRRCPQCGEKFKRGEEFIVHRRSHDGERPYVCTLCKERFLTQKCLLNHIGNVHDKMFMHMCTKCGKTSRDNAELALHKCSSQHCGEHRSNTSAESRSNFGTILIVGNALASKEQTANLYHVDGLRSSNAIEDLVIDQSTVLVIDQSPEVIDQSTVYITHTVKQVGACQMIAQQNVSVPQVIAEQGDSDSQIIAQQSVSVPQVIAQQSGSESQVIAQQSSSVSQIIAQQSDSVSQLIAQQSGAVSHIIAQQIVPTNTIEFKPRDGVNINTPIIKTIRAYTGQSLALKTPRCKPRPSEKCCMCEKILDSEQSVNDHYRREHFDKSNKNISCVFCSFQTSHARNFANHVRLHTGERPYVCAQCDKKFRSMRNLNKHARTVHEGKKCFPPKISRRSYISNVHGNMFPTSRCKPKPSEKCCMCEKMLDSDQSLNDHYRREHFDRSSKKILCIFCAFKTSDAANFASHVRLHTGERPYVCAQCDEKCISMGRLNYHVRTVHEGEIFNKCPRCGKTFAQLAALQRHQLTHAVERLYACTRCDKRFQHEKTLKYHILRFHEELLKYICMHCGKSFRVRDALNLHIIRHHGGERRFLCTVCGKKYPTKALLKKHEVCHSTSRSDKLYACPQCDKSFTQSSSRTTHIKRVHSEERPFVCVQCGKKYILKTLLDEHIVSHTGERPYACKQCDKTFIYEKSLCRHKKEKHYVGHGYKCTHCDMKLTQRTSLFRHIKLMHSNECPYVCAECKRRFSEGILLKLHLKTHQ